MKKKSKLKIFLIIVLLILLSVAIYVFINLDYIKQEISNRLQDKYMHDDSGTRCIPNPDLGIECSSDLRKVESSTEDILVITTEGIVLENNMEDGRIGSYLHVKRTDTDGDLYVVYQSFENYKEIECINSNNIDPWDININDHVQVKGSKIKEIKGMKPISTMISTCGSPEYYIKVIN